MPKSPNFDKSMDFQSGSGITIGGEKTLEEYLYEEQAKEDSVEVNTPDPVSRKNRPIIRYKDRKGPDGVGRVWTRKEIIMETWEEQIEKTENVDKAFCILFLRGEEYTGTELKQTVIKYFPDKNMRTIEVRLSHILNKTDFGKLILRRREGKGMAMRLVPAALDLTPSELHLFVYKKPKQKKELLEKYIGLKPYFAPEESGPAMDAHFSGSPDPADPVKPITESASISATIETALKEALGVNVHVSGRIEIAFKFGD
jgi:hypothetical protein